MIKHQGGCHCGKVRFTTDYDPLLVIQCNCNRCRRLMGTLNVFAVFGKEEIEFAGKTTKYTYKGGSGMDAHVYSCPVCCTRVYGEAEAFDGMRSVVLGAFDDSLALEPKSEIFTNYKMKWIQDNGCVQESFEEAAIVERLSSLMQKLDQRS